MPTETKPESIEEADALILDWVNAVLPNVSIHFGPPSLEATQTGVSVYLIALDEAPALRGPGRAPLQIQAQYLITVLNTEQKTAHRHLNTLIFAALRHQSLEVTFHTLSPELWTALNIIPQPAFLVSTPIVVEQPLPNVPIVREPPTIDGVPTTTFRGLLLGPDDIPLANAVVEYPSLQRRVQTNVQGEFALNTIPREPKEKQLRVRARGKVFELMVEQPAQPDAHAIIHLPLLD